MPVWVWRMDIKGSKQEYLKWGEKGVSKHKIHWSKDHHARRMLWWHLIWQTLFILCAAFHSPSKWSQKASRKKAAWLRELLAAFLCRECQGHNINLQTLLWSLSLPSLVFLRLLHLLLGESHCMKIFYSPSFFMAERKTSKRKPLHRALIFHGEQSGLQHLEMTEHLRISIWKKTLPGGRWIRAPRERPECHDKAVSGLSHADGCSSLWFVIASVHRALIINIDAEEEEIYWNIPQFLPIGIFPCPFWLGFRLSCKEWCLW